MNLLLKLYRVVLQNSFGISFTNLIVILLLSGCGTQSKKESAEFFERGNFHFKKNEFNYALNFYTEAIGKTPTFADAYHNRGLVYLKIEETEMAIEDFKKAVEIDPEFDLAKYNLAKTYTEFNQPKEAELLYNEIEKTYADSTFYYCFRGINQANLGNSIEAKAFLNQSLKLDSNYLSLSSLGVLAYQAKEYATASTFFKESISKNPSYLISKSNLGLSLAAQKEFTLAEKWALEAYSAEPSSLLFNNNLTYVYLLNGQFDKVPSLLEKAEKLDPANSYLLRNKGIFLLEKGNNTLAFESLKKCEELDPTTENLYPYLIKAAKLSGNAKAAANYELIYSAIK